MDQQDDFIVTHEHSLWIRALVLSDPAQESRPGASHRRDAARMKVHPSLPDCAPIAGCGKESGKV
jgi:hypothetical protein